MRNKLFHAYQLDESIFHIRGIWIILILYNFFYLDHVKRIWYLSPIRAAKVQASLRIRAVSPEPSLLAYTSSESRGAFRQKARSQAPLNGWACAVKTCHDGMLEDTNSLDGAHLMQREQSAFCRAWCIFQQPFNRLLSINAHFEYCFAVWARFHIISFKDNLSLVTRKSVFGVSDQGRLKLVCSAT